MTTKGQLDLPRGVRMFHEEGRPKPFACQWRVDGRRKSKWFRDAASRDKFAVGLAGDARELGVAAFRLDPSEAHEWRAFRAQLGEAVALDDVLACWLRHGKARPALTVNTAVERFLVAKGSEGLAGSTLAHYRPVYDRLKAALGESDVARVTREDIAGWLDGLKMADYSRRTHHTRARGLFAWLKTNRLIAESPCDGLKPVRIVPEEVAILTVEQGRELFAQNMGEPPELLGRMALEAFAGLRFSSAAQVVGADILFPERGINLPAAKIKTRRRQFIDGLPDNLWQWLGRSFLPVAWSMTPREYMKAKSDAFIRARIPHPHNCLRHSFATYHVAANKDVSRTAVILCHSSPKMLWAHYKGRAAQADGAAWFGIAP